MTDPNAAKRDKRDCLDELLGFLCSPSTVATDMRGVVGTVRRLQHVRTACTSFATLVEDPARATGIVLSNATAPARNEVREYAGERSGFSVARALPPHDVGCAFMRPRSPELVTALFAPAFRLLRVFRWCTARLSWPGRAAPRLTGCPVWLAGGPTSPVGKPSRLPSVRCVYRLLPAHMPLRSASACAASRR